MKSELNSLSIMRIGATRRVTCRLCGVSAPTRVLSLPATPPANAFIASDDLGEPQTCYPLDVHLCSSCGHLQLLDVVDPEILFRDYVYVSGTSPSFVKHFQDYAVDCIARFASPTASLAVDIGSNDGTLLAFFKSSGMQVLGIDPARAIAEAATRHGIDTWSEFLSPEVVRRILAEKSPASLITANNVFAHVDDLAVFTDCVRDLLAPDGVFVFEVSYAADVHANILFDTIYHEHLSYHTVAPLIPFFAAHGLELFSSRRVPTHGGSLRGYVQRAGGPRKPDGSVTSFVAGERARQLDKVEGWAPFAERINRLGAELTQLLWKLKSEGKRIAGFGAPAKATTLMYSFGLDRTMIDYIVDDSPLKQGLFTPGRHVPVVPWSQIGTVWPDYLIVLAWNFADTIMANRQDYLNNGGHFIVPLPELRIV